MADFFRKSGAHRGASFDKQIAGAEGQAAANDAVVSFENGTRVTRLPYIPSAVNSSSRSPVTQQVLLDEDQWRFLEETTASEEWPGDADTVDECFSRGMEIFFAQMPERGHALNMQMDGASVGEIAAQLGRTVAATKEYLSQCRKHLQPFVAHCRELLSG